ncbi:Macrolide export ATP-binding/permease protein MacB [Planctomycetes bacterium Poly30]|uniref:Macrolide export ATP-binding/permease protein MacB n=1 Tax=Saltatorellus ferox TaxID=2528018 RepID=A0A518EKQ1_9BACT|nr:Macrolide export ATP-binding/permease protein MacB [Planctomycetes bacterium Poly30]
MRRRTLMTLLGVAWGTFSTVALLSFGEGLEKEMVRRAEGMGRGIMILWPGTTSRSSRGMPEGQRIRLLPSDTARLRTEVQGLEAVCPEFLRSEPVVHGEKVFRAMLAGVGENYGELRSMDPAPGGRFLSARDVEEERTTAFLGDRIGEELFPGSNPVGQRVVIGGTQFTIVGVMQSKVQDSDYDGKDSMRVCLPVTTFQRRFGTRYLDNFVLRPRDSAAAEDVMRDATKVLAAAKGFDPEDEAALRWWDTTKGDQVRRYAFLAMDVMTGGAGILTLLVGGLGLANLMFLRVRARTEEIGLMMALGATRRRVLIGVLGDALGLTAVGGAIGAAAAVGAGWLVSSSPLRESVGSPEVAPWLALGTVAGLAFLGVLAGWFPARRAARLDPVLALGGHP